MRAPSSAKASEATSVNLKIEVSAGSEARSSTGTARPSAIPSPRGLRSGDSRGSTASTSTSKPSSATYGNAAELKIRMPAAIVRPRTAAPRTICAEPSISRATATETASEHNIAISLTLPWSP